MKRLLLLGAGHAQLAVLSAFARERLPSGADVRLVSAHARQFYSGMVPGLVAGRYDEADCAIEVAPLAQAAGVRFQVGRAVALDAAQRTVTLADGQVLPYDIVSINTGPTQRRDRIDGAREHALFVRPIEGFVELWKRTRALADDGPPLALVIVGNGAAGVELAFAVRRALGARASVSIVGEGELLPQHGAATRKRALAALRRANVQVLPGPVTAIERWHVRVGPSMRIACAVPIVATGADAPEWLAASGLALDAAGWLRVGPTLQSASHPEVFAAGDVIVRDDAPHPRSGVYAVRAGPVLAANLRAALVGGTELQRYEPQRRSLNLLALGDGRAIASYGEWSMQGWAMGWWKDRIDRAFVRRYAPRPAHAR